MIEFQQPVLRRLKLAGREVRSASLVNDVLVVLGARAIGATVVTANLSDSCVQKNETVRARAMQYLAAEGRVTVSATVMEVVKGLHRVAREAELLRLLGSAAGMEVIPVGRDEAVEAGRILRRLGTDGPAHRACRPDDRRHRVGAWPRSRHGQ